MLPAANGNALAGVAQQLQQAPNPTLEPNRIVLLLARVGSADGTGRDSWPPACSRRSMTTVSQTANENGRFARLLDQKGVDRQRRLPVCCPISRPCVPNETTEDAALQALVETGATGLEPATSGVTGRRSRWSAELRLAYVVDDRGELPSSKSSQRLQVASALQASSFRSDVTVFRLNAVVLGESGSQPAFLPNTAERAYTFETAHNPEVRRILPSLSQTKKPCRAGVSTAPL
jgi:hypothetical protein